MRSGRRSGFTLVELLTVIGIIAILMAILFPVAGAVKKSIKKTGCVSNMHQIAAALKMYYNDQRYLPPHLLPYDPKADPNNDPVKRGMKDAVGPITLYVRDTNLLHCPGDEKNKDPRAFYSPAVDPFGNDIKDGNNLVNFYLYNSYDGQKDPVLSSYRVHYSLDRPAKDFFPNDNDPNRKRLLKFRNPPDDTVITYCKYHRDLYKDSNGDFQVAEGSMDTVVFWSGTGKPIPSSETRSLPGFQRGQ